MFTIAVVTGTPRDYPRSTILEVPRHTVAIHGLGDEPDCLPTIFRFFLNSLLIDF
jgi:hypothetical protein